MNYTSTRKSTISITAADAIVKGISEEGGLFVPAQLSDLPKLTLNDFQKLSEKTYNERAFDILKPLLDFKDEELRNCIENAYNFNFNTIGMTRTVKIDDLSYMLELWHGPTAAFKDMALQILPGLLNLSAKKTGGVRGKMLILTATSGDTGKAALEGFKDVEGTEIAVFYPEDGVSDIQKLQMASAEGANVHVFAVKGNFDDCQNAVKAVFTDSEVVSKAARAGVCFSSANSINWGRLCPQIVYYVSAYAQMIREKAIRCGDAVNICVPTGNFGNILAAYYAMEMGVPVGKLICASNANNILTDFINTGVYDCNREFHTTVSPSMDILISSNLERLLYHLSGNNDVLINEWFTSLKETGKFEVDAKLKRKLKSMFYAGWCSEEETSAAIKAVYNEHGYLMDTHTAVGYKVWRDFCGESIKGKSNTRTKTRTIIASTASPYKFSEAVYESLYGRFEKTEESDAERVDSTGLQTVQDVADEVQTAVIRTAMSELERHTGVNIPKPLAAINERQVRFTETLEKSEIKKAVLKILS